MRASYSINVDPALDLVRIHLTGFFKPEDIAGFQAQRVLAHKRLTCGPNQHHTLTDVREMAIQSQDAVAGFSKLLADPAWVSRRLAFITASTLARMQLQRAIGDRDEVRCFMDAAEAEAWLLEAGPATRTA